MDDIKSLCERCVVINNGKKIYDGNLDMLFNRYQTHKTMTVTFDDATSYCPDFDIQIIEQNPFKLSFMAIRKDVRSIIGVLMNDCEVNDISIEEEDIGNVVERIYSDKGGDIQ
jgi:ABC-2 type transport system ATP-binding protein